MIDLTAEQIQVRRLAKFLRYNATIALAGCVASWLVTSAVFRLPSQVLAAAYTLADDHGWII